MMPEFTTLNLFLYSSLLVSNPRVFTVVRDLPILRVLLALALRPKHAIQAMLARKIATQLNHTFATNIIASTNNLHSKETWRRDVRIPDLRGLGVADVPVVFFPAGDGVLHRPVRVHVPAFPHLVSDEIVAAAEGAIVGTVPGEKVHAARLLVIPGVVGFGAFGFLDVGAENDEHLLVEAAHLPEERLALMVNFG